ncbi:hypothetical protein BDAP_002289 [Binucleata daphniae]
MFKKYKITKKKETFSVKTKQINIKTEHKERSEIYKIKSLLNQKNKKNALKKIIKLKQEDFDENIYYLTINVCSEALINTNALIIQIVKRILKSNKFYVVQEVIEKYMQNIECGELQKIYKCSVGKEVQSEDK